MTNDAFDLPWTLIATTYQITLTQMDMCLVSTCKLSLLNLVSVKLGLINRRPSVCVQWSLKFGES